MFQSKLFTFMFKASRSAVPKVPKSSNGSKGFSFRGFHNSPKMSAQYRRFNNSSSGSNQINLSRLLLSRNTIYAGIGVVAFCAYNLENAPVTDRLRLLWVPYWMESKIGGYSYSQILSEYKDQILPSSDPTYKTIGKVMNKLLDAAISNSSDPAQRDHLLKLDWKIHIIQVDPKKVPPNAFILPNGKIFVFSSILPICNGEDGLATVLSHELSHQLARHTSEQLSKQPFYIALSLLMYAATGVDWIGDVLINGVLRMPASREMEIEADHIGCTLMAKSCYNLGEAVKFWQRMYKWEETVASQRGAGALQEFFSTHPGTERRIENIKTWMPELRNVQEASGCYEHQFGMFMDQTSTRKFF
ncbi:mitochondrial metalloendopeptidase Oma1p [[Candida] railenensis]|uniref:Mitochondrial metalloendopeptidase Oma1p n=1 Tax=[Candida] railenensis TaxID=45579 RepID=A0A9P0W119_9ASCO|nr:mitochondrial metalloendopeptidase Oma1p [[Candida] railenensis]